MKNKKIESTWESFEDSEPYKKFVKKRESLNDEKSAANNESLNIELHNNSDSNYQKTLDTIKYFVSSSFGKVSHNQKWKVEVWVDQENIKKSKHDELISCGVALKRPGTSVLYAKKIAGNLNRAISKSLEVLEDAVIGERQKWKTAKTDNSQKGDILWR